MEQQTEAPQSLQKIIQSISSKRDDIIKNRVGKKALKCECGEIILSEDGYKKCYRCREKERIETERLLKIQQRKDNPEIHLEKIGVGRRYRSSTIESFNGGSKYVKFCRDWLKSPVSLFLYGKCGCGKTHLASAICRELATQDILPKILFVNASDLFLKIRSTFRPDGDSEIDVVNSLCRPDYLFIDDLGAEKTSDWSRATMYLIIDRRDREMLPTIITSNLSPSDLGGAIDGRISSRIANGKIVNIDMPDYRLKR